MSCITDNVDLSAVVMPYDDDDDDDDEDSTTSTISASGASGAGETSSTSAIVVGNNSSSSLKKRCWAPYWADTTYHRYFWMDTGASASSASGSNFLQSHYGFDCGRCYSWAGTCKSVQVDNYNEEVNISFMWWPYINCQSKYSGSKTKKGTKVWVKAGVSQHFKIPVRSFYVQCNKNDQWPDADTGDTPTWPINYL